MLLPFLLTACGGSGDLPTSGSSGGKTSGSVPSGDSESIIDIDTDTYDEWANSWSKPGHLYFHYNRGDKFGYDNYCLWLWQHDPQDLEGALWGFSADPKVSDKLTLQPMTTSFMTYKDVGKESEGEGTFIDNYGIIIDVDYDSTTLHDGKQGNATTYEGATELGFLLPQQDSMSGLTNWVSDGGRETYVEGIEKSSSNWRSVEGGKALHIFVATGALDEYTFFAGEGVPEAKTNPIDEDSTGQYSSAVDTKYTNTLGNSSTSSSFKDLGAGYQIFVASFRDSDGDGKGDLRGIIQALEEGFFTELNIDVLWLTPIQKSDSYHGYDISDYYQVDKKFGSVEDYQELIYKAHKAGIKVLMDLVLNHTSKSNRWFINSQWGLEEDGIKWRDVYTWKYETELIDKWDGYQYKKITVKDDAESQNPSWYRDGESHYYYYGKFGSGMPEINYLSATTRKLVINMARYWMSFGLDGFRLDAVKHIFMRDECYQDGDIIIPDTGSKTSYDTEKGTEVTRGFDYSSNLTKNIMWWKEFAHGVKAAYPDCFLVGENFDGWGTRTAPYYQALDSQFDFGTYYHIASQIYAPEGQGGVGAFGYKHPAETYDVFGSTSYFPLGDTGISVPGGGRADYIDGNFTSNHDVMRAINQVNWTSFDATAGTTPNPKITGTAEQINRAKIHAAVTILGQGISWIYYGDELGMSSNTDQHIQKYKYENNIDIWYRQPYLWQNTAHRPNYKAGQFLFELDTYNKTIKSYEEQKNDSNSMYKWYKAMTAIKREYPRDAKVRFEWGTNVLVVIATSNVDAKKVVSYINVGGSGEYITNPFGAIGGQTPIISIGGASETPGAQIGGAQYSVVAFKNA